jgi:hypothetical protein
MHVTFKSTVFVVMLKKGFISGDYAFNCAPVITLFSDNALIDFFPEVQNCKYNYTLYL